MPSGVWLEIHSEALRGFVKLGLSFTEAAKKLNSEFGTRYTRNACIGRAQRMGVAGHLKRGRRPKQLVAKENQTRWKLQSARRKAQRWAVKPWLAQREAQIEARRKEREEIGKRVMESCKSKTSATYRNQLPRIGNVTKTELRAMLASAIQNTAAMELA
jgi:hypothetical protein